MECRPGLALPFFTVPTVGHSASALSFIQHHLCISAVKVNILYIHVSYIYHTSKQQGKFTTFLWSGILLLSVSSDVSADVKDHFSGFCPRERLCVCTTSLTSASKYESLRVENAEHYERLTQKIT